MRSSTHGKTFLQFLPAESPSVPTSRTRISRCCHGVIFYQGEPVLDQRKTRLEGFHNAENLMAALGVGLALGVELETMAAAVV